MKRVKKILFRVALVLLLAIIGFVLYVYFYPVKDREIFDYLPKDAVFVVESKDPINDWKKFSSTKSWKFLKQNPLFADIQETADWLDEMIEDNSTLFGLVSGHQFLLSAHMTEKKNYDFLYMMDLEEAGKIQAAIDVLKTALAPFGLDLHSKKLGEYDIYGSGSGIDEILIAFNGDILLITYSAKIMEQALNQQKEPYFSKDKQFMALRDRLSGDGLCRFYMNYAQLDDFLGVYSDPVPVQAKDFSNWLQYGAFDVSVSDQDLHLFGYSSINEENESLLSAMRQSKASEPQAGRVLPANTSFYLSTNFQDFNTFYQMIEADMRKDTASFEDYDSNRRKVEKFLKISFEEHFFSWIGNEITVALAPAPGQGTKQAYLLTLHAPDTDLAKEKLAYVLKKIKRRSPVKFKEQEYKGVAINYLEMKSFFKIFLGKLFKKFDKPHFIILDNYVIFSNHMTALESTIDHYQAKNTLSWNGDFRKFYDRFDASSNYYIYLDMKHLYNHLFTLVSPETGAGIRKNKRFITSFPQMGMQLTEEDGYYRSDIQATFRPVY